MNETPETDAELVDLETGLPVVVDPATGAARFKNRRGRPPKNPRPIVPVPAPERAARLAAGGGKPADPDSAPADGRGDDEVVSLVAAPPAASAAAEPAAPAAEPAPAGDPPAAAAGVDPEALLRARRAAALRMKQGLDSLASSVSAMNAFFAASPKLQAAIRAESPEAQRQRQQQQQRQRQQQQQQQRQRPQQQPMPPRQRPQQQPPQPQQRRPQPGDAGAFRAPEPPAEPRAVLPPLKVFDLQSLSATELRRLALEQNLLSEGPPPGRHETVFALLQEHVRRGGSVEGEGYLDVWQEGYGFLRSPLADFKTVPEDVFVPQQVIQRGGLRPGDHVVCRTRPGDRGQRERRFSATDLISVNGLAPDKARRAMPFSSLSVADPVELLRFRGASGDDPLAAAIDLLSPVALGGRAIVALPRRADHAAAARRLAAAVAAARPAASLAVAVFGAAPETRAAFAAEPVFRDRRATLLATDFEDGPDKALQLASVLTDAARRRAEGGADVVVVVDSLTALARAFGMTATNQQGALTDGVDGRALQKARRLFASGRRFADRPGSVTVVALFETGAPGSPQARIVEEFLPAATAFLECPARGPDHACRPVPDPDRAWSLSEPLLSPEERAAAAALRKTLAAAASRPGFGADELAAFAAPPPPAPPAGPAAEAATLPVFETTGL